MQVLPVPCDCLCEALAQAVSGLEVEDFLRAWNVEAAARLAVRFGRIPNDVAVETDLRCNDAC